MERTSKRDYLFTPENKLNGHCIYYDFARLSGSKLLQNQDRIANTSCFTEFIDLLKHERRTVVLSTESVFEFKRTVLQMFINNVTEYTECKLVVVDRGYLSRMSSHYVKVFRSANLTKLPSFLIKLASKGPQQYNIIKGLSVPIDLYSYEGMIEDGTDLFEQLFGNHTDLGRKINRSIKYFGSNRENGENVYCWNEDTTIIDGLIREASLKGVHYRLQNSIRNSKTYLCS